MQYEEALKVWGASRLRKAYPKAKIVPDAVVVSLETNYGYSCCGGSDPDCYCSLAESPSGYVEISAGRYSVEIDHYEFDFATILKEIVAAADGTITE